MKTQLLVNVYSIQQCRFAYSSVIFLIEYHMIHTKYIQLLRNDILCESVNLHASTVFESLPNAFTTLQVYVCL